MVNCDCCGKGVLEIKCPHYHKDKRITEASNDKMCCVSQQSNGSYYLDRPHAYYYYVQTQIFVYQKQYCDFVICTFPHDQCEPSMHTTHFPQWGIVVNFPMQVSWLLPFVCATRTCWEVVLKTMPSGRQSNFEHFSGSWPWTFWRRMHRLFILLL